MPAVVRRLADLAQDAVFLTAAFGLTAEIRPVFDGHRDYLRYLLLDLETGNVEAVRREPGNVVAAGGFKAKGGWRRWIARGLTNLNGHVGYVHTKFMLIDPLGTHPIVITGSANWSDESVKTNDENMLVIHGDQRITDIYLTEFMRLFNHYRLRGKAHSAANEQEPGPGTTPAERGNSTCTPTTAGPARSTSTTHPRPKNDCSSPNTRPVRPHAVLTEPGMGTQDRAGYRSEG